MKITSLPRKHALVSQMRAFAQILCKPLGSSRPCLSALAIVTFSVMFAGCAHQGSPQDAHASLIQKQLQNPGLSPQDKAKYELMLQQGLKINQKPQTSPAYNPSSTGH
jgi:hypothetical protein